VDQLKRFAVITLALWVAISWTGPAAAQSSDSRSGAAKADDTLIVGIDPGFPPFALLTMDGRPAGLLVDVWRLWAKKTGRKIEFLAADWGTLMDKLRSGGIDINFGLFRSKERDKWIDFSQPFYESGSRLFFPTDLAQEPTLDSLAGAKVGVVKGTFQENYLRKNHPKVEAVPMANTEKLLEAMLVGDFKAFISEDLITDHLVSRLGLQGEVEEGSEALIREKIHAGIEKGRSELLAIIDKGFNDITNAELRRIEQRWIRDPDLRFFRADDTKLRLTQAEEAWLKRHKSVRVMVGTWPPFHYVEDDKNKGLALDYVRKILGDLGLELKPVRILWADALSSISKFEKLDLLPTIARSKEREKLVNITRDYLSFPSVIVTQKEGDAIKSLKDLYGRKVAVENNFIMHKRLARDHPAIEIDPRKTTKAALSAVSLGEATAYVGNLAVASYLIEKFGFANLKIAAQTDYAHDTQAIGVRRDWPELASMIEKSLAAITEEEHAALREKALSVSLVTGLDVATVAKWGGGIGAVAVVVIVVFVLWTRRLGREIDEREQAEAELRESERRLTAILETSPIGVAIVSVESGKRIYVNPRVLKLFGAE
jgi:polar amino acid transport system substrate-binding protein